jgi:DNA-binding CsgD family transcriptional regulator
MTQSPQLSNREREVVELLLQGHSNKLIASSLTVSIRTVEFHLRNIYAKHQVSSRVELIVKLGNTTDGLETEKLVDSTVDWAAEPIENGDSSHSPMNWRTSLKQTISIFNKEFRMTDFLKPDAYDDSTPMTFQNSIRVCLSKYADFEGEASRAEFWWFALFVGLGQAALTYIHINVGSLFAIAMLLPLLAVGARRLHDIGKSAWWLLFGLAPVAGLVVLAVLWALPPEEPAADKFLRA